MSVRKDIREQLQGAVTFDNPSFDNSIIGTTTDGRVVYSYEKMVAELWMSDAKISMYDAQQYIEDNIIAMLSRDNSIINELPIIMYEKTWITKYHS